MQALPLERLDLGYSDDVITQTVYYSADSQVRDCSLSRNLPMLIESLQSENVSCAGRFQYDSDNDEELQHYEPLPNGNPPRRKKKKSWWQRVFG